MYTYNILLFLLPILAILSEIFSSVEIYSEIKLTFVEIQISKRKSIRIFLLSHFFYSSHCMNFTLKSQVMAIPDFENQNFIILTSHIYVNTIKIFKLNLNLYMCCNFINIYIKALFVVFTTCSNWLAALNETIIRFACFCFLLLRL